jgi:AcrR family transcriptional regulator
MTAGDRPYHHGNLRQALVDAAVELAREGGPDAIVVREASRRVGVSHNAAYRHFPDRGALLEAVCDECMSALALLMEDRIAALGTSRSKRAVVLRLRATGQAYVEFALAEPGWFRTAFAVPPDRHYRLVTRDGRPGPYQILAAQLDGLVTAGVLPAERRPLAEIPAWAGVHGFAGLALDGPLRDASAQEREAGLTRLLDNIERGL